MLLTNPNEGAVPNPEFGGAAGVGRVPKAKVVAGVVGAGVGRTG